MILPIVIYGNPILRKKASPIDANYPNLPELINNMWETMDRAHGIGLAAPQVGLSIRLFVIDASPLQEEYPEQELDNFKKVFINAQILNSQGEPWKFEEGCLSIPNLRDVVARPEEITMKYQDEEWNWHEETFSGFKARVIQHEYDHIEGILFIDYLSPLKKSLIKSKLDAMKKGKYEAKYKTLPPSK